MGSGAAVQTTTRGESMNTKEAVKYLRIITDSFDPNTAPRFAKDKIEGERDKARAAVALAIASLEGGK
jgi:hypothetical protein